MRITWEDIQWVGKHQPQLFAGLDSSMVLGNLEVSAYYYTKTQRLIAGQRFAVGRHESFIADQFPIAICLDDADQNGWPKVYDLAKRYRSIAERYVISVADLTLLC